VTGKHAATTKINTSRRAFIHEILCWLFGHFPVADPDPPGFSQQLCDDRAGQVNRRLDQPFLKPEQVEAVPSALQHFDQIALVEFLGI
jgi:hypothetical protein